MSSALTHVSVRTGDHHVRYRIGPDRRPRPHDFQNTSRFVPKPDPSWSVIFLHVMSKFSDSSFKFSVKLQENRHAKRWALCKNAAIESVGSSSPRPAWLKHIQGKYDCRWCDQCLNCILEKMLTCHLTNTCKLYLCQTAATKSAGSSSPSPRPAVVLAPT